MRVDRELIKHVAEVARLNLTDVEIKMFIPQLKEILNAFSAISEVKTDDVKPSFHPVELKNVMRPDKVEKCLTQEEALRNTRHKKDGYFKGPRAV